MADKDPIRRNMRFLALGLIIGLGAWWAGARWGVRGPDQVKALPQATGAAALTEEESVNVRVYRQAAPSVANIVTQTVQYDFFFNPVSLEGAGSGFVIDDRGYVLTNYHVVEGAQSIEVMLGDDRARNRYPAKLVGGDPRNDIALLKIDPQGRKLVPLPLGDAGALQVGQRVLAIGNPFGFQSTLTTGVVSALGRTVQTGENTFIDEAIQTDAAINRGNSGGPLLNTQGQVIGINTAIYTPSGTTAGIGFAIPVSTAKQIAEDLMRDGRVHRAFLGIQGLPLWPGLAEALKLPVSEGMLIEVVTPGGPAARAGIQGGSRAVVAGMQRIYVGGDILVAVDARAIASPQDLNLAMNRKRPGDVATLTLYRGQQKIDVKVTLGER